MNGNRVFLVCTGVTEKKLSLPSRNLEQYNNSKLAEWKKLHN